MRARLALNEWTGLPSEPWVRTPISALRLELDSGRIMARFPKGLMKHQEQPEPEPGGSKDGWFPRTHWSQVVEAGRESSPGAQEAFGGLYRCYSPPLLAFLRGRGHSPAEAEDLVQGFFEFLFTHKGLTKVDRRGKFRSWLLGSMKHFESDAWDKARAQKRGSGQAHVALQTEDSQHGVDPQHPGRTPDQEFDRQFALRFLELVQQRLEQEYRLNGKQPLFECLRPLLLDKKGGPSHAELGRTLGMTEVHVSKAVSLLRQRYRDIFDAELKILVGLDGDIEEEKRVLFQALTK